MCNAQQWVEKEIEFSFLKNIYNVNYGVQVYKNQ